MSEAQDTSSAAESTREQLLDAAERLFLEHGLDEVSLRAIVREAGQRNQSALQYHFGGREALIAAILNRRMQQVEARRRSLVDAALAGGAALELRDGCALLVRAPFLLCRERRDFRTFLGQFGQRLLASGRDITLAADHQQLPSLRDMRRLLRHELGHLHPELLDLRTENANSLALLAISRRARRGGSFRGRRAELFFNNLVDQVAAMLAAPVSPATEALLDGAD
jgi:AcrR family transcriptional regulator